MDQSPGDLPPLPMGTTAKGKLPPKGQGDPDGRPTSSCRRKNMASPKTAKTPNFTPFFPTASMAWANPIWNWHGTLTRRGFILSQNVGDRMEWNRRCWA